MWFWGFFAQFINTAIIQGMTGSSLGKRIVGIEVVNIDGEPIGVVKSALREMAKLVSALPFALGYLMIFWDKKNRCLHDRLLTSLVVERGYSKAQASQTKLSPIEPAKESVTDETFKKAA
jgi:uncharacterized RDD family membrane protein YckC